MKTIILVLIMSVGWHVGTAYTDAEPLPVITQAVDVEVEPGIRLEAPKTCEIGELVRLDARGSNVTDLVWDILPKTIDFETVDGDKRAFFSARSSGEYLILIAGAKDGKAFLVHQKLIVNGVPAKMSSTARKIGQWLTLVQGVPDRNANLVAMAGVFRKLSEQPVDPDKMVEATALANSAVLGDNLTGWIPFLDKLGTELDELVDEGKLDTVEQYQATWAAIAKALLDNVKG